MLYLAAMIYLQESMVLLQEIWIPKKVGASDTGKDMKSAFFVVRISSLFGYPSGKHTKNYGKIHHF